MRNREPFVVTPSPSHSGTSHAPARSSRVHPTEHPRTIGWLGTTALAMGGSNQSLFLIAALIAGQGSIPGQGSAAVPLLIIGLLLSWAAAPGWTELILMWPNRVGGIAAACSEAFRPYNPLLAAITGTCYWWGWVPTCGLTALLSASAIQQWFLPSISVTVLATLIVCMFLAVNLCGIRWVVRLAIPIAAVSALPAFLSAVVPVFTGKVDWIRASTFHLNTPFAGMFGMLTSVMAGIYLIGFAAPAFEAASCHVGETIDPARNVPRAMLASALMAAVYFVILPVVWLGVFGPIPLTRDLAVELGPTFAPLLGGAAKAAAIGFMMFNMFHGTIQPLAGAARTLSQLSEDGLLPEALALRNRNDVPWVATTGTAAFSILFLWIGDPVWLIAAANFTYLIGVCMPSIAVWLLRLDAPHAERPFRAGRGMIGVGLLAALVWLVSAVFGFEQFGISTVIIGLGFAYSGTALYAWRKVADRRREGLPGFKHTLHVTLTGSMMLVLVLDATGNQLAVNQLPRVDKALISALEDIFVAVAMLTITVGLVLPGMIAHSVVEVSGAAKRLVSGTLHDFSQAMEALARGNLASATVDPVFIPVEVRSRDEIGEMASSFNELQREIQRSAIGLIGAREGLGRARQQLLNTNMELEERVDERSELITKLTEARDAAEAANIAKGRFVAKMSHEIRTPMNGVLSTLDLLRHSDITPTQEKLISIIERSGATLLALVNEVLDYSRVNSGKLHFEIVEFDLLEFVRHRFDEMAAQAVESKLDYRLELPAGVPSIPVVCDPLQLTLVLQNLISNALKFTNAGSLAVKVGIVAEREEEISVEFTVADTGIGMSDAFKTRVFEPFEQANDSTTKKFDGAGLGLSIVKEIVDAVGGDIRIDTAEGRGTTVRVVWPMTKAALYLTAAVRDAPQRHSPPVRSRDNGKILVAEDNPINQEVIAASLSRLGHEFIIVGDGAAALDAMENERFSLVLMDCRMPIMDGFEATRAIRNREAETGVGGRIPIVAISANAMQGDRELCLASGMDDHIAKPFTLAQLSQVFDRWMLHTARNEAPAEPANTPTAACGPAPYTMLDVEMLETLADIQIAGEPSIVARLIDSFTETTPVQMEQIESSLAAEDYKSVMIAAHGMKSASIQLGLPKVSAKFRDLEDAAKEGDLQKMRGFIASLYNYIPICLDELGYFKPM